MRGVAGRGEVVAEGMRVIERKPEARQSAVLLEQATLEAQHSAKTQQAEEMAAVSVSMCLLYDLCQRFYNV